ncbi:MAG: hypothetical protein ABIH42_07270 [Planctomycetota bacterium]
MGKWMALVVSIAVCMLIGNGCIEMEEELSLNKDGSGTVKFHMACSEEMAQMMQAAQGPEADISSQLPKSKEELAKGWGNKEGIEITEFTNETKEGKIHLNYSVKFKDINVLREIDQFNSIEFSRGVCKSCEDEGGEHGGNVIYERDSGASSFLPPEQDTSGMTAEEKAMAEQMQQQMMQMCRGLKLKYTVTFPNHLEDSTGADKVDGNTVMWEYTFDKLMQMRKENKSFVMKAVFCGEGVTFVKKLGEEEPTKEPKGDPIEEPQKEKKE